MSIPTLLRFGSKVAVLLLVAFPTLSFAQNGQEARLPVKIIAGRLVVRCEISTPRRRIPASLFVVLDRPCGLELHNKATDYLEAEKGAGLPITLHFSGMDVVVPRREHGDEDFLNEFTRLYSTPLGDIACIGSIGSSILQNYRVVVDIASGFVTLGEPAAPSGGPPQQVDGAETTSITLVNDQIWLPVRGPDGKGSSMNLSTSRYDSIVDRDYCERVGRPAGDIGKVNIRSLDVSQFVALRPEELVQVHSDGALGSLGLGFLENFKVEIDRVNRFARLTQTKAAEFPVADLAFFKARATEESEPLLAFLNAYGKSRLSREAAELLMDLLLQENADSERMDKALKWVNDTRIEDLRSTEALTTMKTLLAARRTDLAIKAGELGVESGRGDRYPESVHRLHALLGELILEGPDKRAAWEHLLSAAFGLPEDGMIHYNLGRFYEGEKRYRRALSRYLQAVVQPESGALAVPALHRLHQTMEGTPLSVDYIDKLIAGKVFNFGAPTKFVPDAKNTSNRVVLAELFTNAHLGRKQGEQWVSIAVGGAMGVEGLLSHYSRQQLAVLSYHLPDPEPSALINELSIEMGRFYGGVNPTVIKINGVQEGPGACLWRDAEGLYERNRELVLDELTVRSDYTLTGTARIEDGRVVGEILVKGPKRSSLNVQIILAERGVLYPGKAQVVVHRMVARGALTKELNGVPYDPTNDQLTVPFDVRLQDVTAKNEAFLEKYEQESGKMTTRLSTAIDPRQVTVVALVRDMAGREVMQALVLDATLPESVEVPK